MPGGLMDGLGGGYRPRFGPQGSGGSLNPYEPAPGQQAGMLEALGVLAPYAGPLMRGVPQMKSIVAPYGTPGRSFNVPASAAPEASGAAINGTMAEMRRLVPNPPPVPRRPGYTPLDVSDVKDVPSETVMDALRFIINGGR